MYMQGVKCNSPCAYSLWHIL